MIRSELVGREHAIKMPPMRLGSEMIVYEK